MIGKNVKWLKSKLAQRGTGAVDSKEIFFQRIGLTNIMAVAFLTNSPKVINLQGTSCYKYIHSTHKVDLTVIAR